MVKGCKGYCSHKRSSTEMASSSTVTTKVDLGLNQQKNCAKPNLPKAWAAPLASFKSNKKKRKKSSWTSQKCHVESLIILFTNVISEFIGKNLSSKWLEGIFFKFIHYMLLKELSTCIFSYMTFFMERVTCLNNIHK